MHSPHRDVFTHPVAAFHRIGVILPGTAKPTGAIEAEWRTPGRWSPSALLPAAVGEVWHIPSPPAITTRSFVDAIADHLGEHPGISVMSPALLAVLSWFNPMLRAVREELFQLQIGWIMDDSKYWDAFGHGETQLDEALAATLGWFRARIHVRLASASWHP